MLYYPQSSYWCWKIYIYSIRTIPCLPFYCSVLHRDCHPSRGNRLGLPVHYEVKCSKWSLFDSQEYFGVNRTCWANTTRTVGWGNPVLLYVGWVAQSAGPTCCFSPLGSLDSACFHPVYLNTFLVMFSAPSVPGDLVWCCCALLHPGQSWAGWWDPEPTVTKHRVRATHWFYCKWEVLTVFPSVARRFRVTGCCRICLCSSGFSVPVAAW